MWHPENEPKHHSKSLYLAGLIWWWTLSCTRIYKGLTQHVTCWGPQIWMLVYTLAITKKEEEKNPENKFEINKSFFFICPPLYMQSKVTEWIVD